MYMKGIQAGIQAAHSQSELLMKCIKQNIKEETLLDILKWSHSPTMIVKNGGDNEAMMHFHSMVERSTFPWCSFYETGLGGILTSITVIIPDINKLNERIIISGCDMGRPGLEGLSEIDQMVVQTLCKMRSAT